MPQDLARPSRAAYPSLSERVRCSSLSHVSVRGGAVDLACGYSSAEVHASSQFGFGDAS